MLRAGPHHDGRQRCANTIDNCAVAIQFSTYLSGPIEYGKTFSVNPSLPQFRTFIVWIAQDSMWDIQTSVSQRNCLGTFSRRADQLFRDE